MKIYPRSIRRAQIKAGERTSRCDQRVPCGSRVLHTNMPGSYMCVLTIENNPTQNICLLGMGISEYVAKVSHAARKHMSFDEFPTIRHGHYATTRTARVSGLLYGRFEIPQVGSGCSQTRMGWVEPRVPDPTRPDAQGLTRYVDSPEFFHHMAGVYLQVIRKLY